MQEFNFQDQQDWRDDIIDHKQEDFRSVSPVTSSSFFVEFAIFRLTGVGNRTEKNEDDKVKQVLDQENIQIYDFQKSNLQQTDETEQKRVR